MNAPTKTLLAVLIGIVSVAAASGLPRSSVQEEKHAQEDAQSDKKKAGETQNRVRPLSRTQIFMRQKLQICDQILRGISTDEFDDITKGTDRLLDMSKRSHWLHASNPAYAQDSADFVANVRLLRSMAEDKNLQGATLAYSQLVVRCSDCHRHVRGPKVAVFNLRSDQVLAQRSSGASTDKCRVASGRVRCADQAS